MSIHSSERGIPHPEGNQPTAPEIVHALDVSWEKVAKHSGGTLWPEENPLKIGYSSFGGELLLRNPKSLLLLPKLFIAHPDSHGLKFDLHHTAVIVEERSVTFVYPLDDQRRYQHLSTITIRRVPTDEPFTYAVQKIEQPFALDKYTRAATDLAKSRL